VHWLAHALGLDNGSGPIYLLWSGVGGDVPIILGALAYLRHRNCHVKRCHRIGRFRVEGTPWTVCARHHPADVPSASDIAKEGS
jgi:hypothetical protein